MSGKTTPAMAGRQRMKRGYSSVSVAEIPAPSRQTEGVSGAAGADPERPCFVVLLDGEPLRSPLSRTIAVPSRPLIEAIAREWEAQGADIDPESMPLTALANSAIDGVSGREGAVRGDIVQYAACDLLCYRADHPEALVARQREAWDGVIAWAAQALGAQFSTAVELLPVAQPEGALAAVGDALAPFDPFGLAAMHVITTLTGSALLALAMARGRMSAEGAWAAAHVDEAFQISRWGGDAEAQQRHERRRSAFEAAGRMLELLGSPGQMPPSAGKR